MQLYCLLLSSLVAMASANPVFNTGRTLAATCSATITAKYDDLPPVSSVAARPQIGTYRGLKYSNLGLTTLGVLGVPPPTGVVAASSPNVIGITRGTAGSYSEATIIGGGAGYTTLSPVTIAYGCVRSSPQKITGVLTVCTVAFTGYRGSSEVGRQFGRFDVGVGQVTKAMSVADLQGFGAVDTVRFEVLDTNIEGVAVLLDNFVYTACT